MKRWIIGIAVFATIAIAAVVLIAYGVATHDEDVLLEVCRGNGGVAIYQTGEVEGGLSGDCPEEERVELRWKREAVPLSVRVSSGSPEGGSPQSDDLRVVEAAVVDFNAQAGFELFTVDRGTEGAPDIALVYGAPAEAGDPPGECRHWLDPEGFASSSAIVIRNVPDDATAFRVVLHELGHGAGLAHDDWAGSLMNRTTLDAEVEELPPSRLTDADRGELRDSYAPR